MVLQCALAGSQYAAVVDMCLSLSLQPHANHCYDPLLWITDCEYIHYPSSLPSLIPDEGTPP